MQSKNISDVIKTVQIPTMPTVVSEALNIIENPKSHINQLADVISKDLSLTSQILKLVNSAYYGFPSQITTINKAMALLGFNQVKSLILSVAVKPMMMTHVGKALWVHSIRTAVASQKLGKSLGMGDTDEAFVMGLLHDIGKIVLEICNKEAAKEVLRLSGLGADTLQAETMFYGFTHTDAGKELVLKWKLPLVIGSAIQYHHNPLRTPQTKLYSNIVYVADRVSQDNLKYPILDPDIVDTFDFEIPDPIEFREQVFEASNSIINALS